MMDDDVMAQQPLDVVNLTGLHQRVTDIAGTEPLILCEFTPEEMYFERIGDEMVDLYDDEDELKESFAEIHGNMMFALTDQAQFAETVVPGGKKGQHITYLGGFAFIQCETGDLEGVILVLPTDAPIHELKPVLDEL